MLNWWKFAPVFDKGVVIFILFFAMFNLFGGPAAVGRLYFGFSQASQSLQQR